MYKLLKDMHGNVASVLLIEQRASIPFDPDNTDYQAYLRWLAEGNQPEPAEENQ